MGAPEGRSFRLAGLLLGATILQLGCLSLRMPPDGSAPLPPQTVVAAPSPGTTDGARPPEAVAPEAVAPEPAAPETPPLPEPTPPAAVPATDSAAQARAKTLTVIDTADESTPEEAQDLASAARIERERRRATDKPIAVINQKNLATWASGGVLTQAAEAKEPSPVESAAVETVEKAAVEEAYWRRRGREIRQKWHDATEQIAVLEAKSNALRNKFYSTDDGYVRDSQVKPEWDKAIADLEEARFTASRGAEEVLAFLEEGRRAGALPGWLREGIELEPEPVVETAAEPDAHEATEPVIYREPGADQDSTEPPPGGARAPSTAPGSPRR